MKIVLVVLALILVIATALPLLRFGEWWIRVFDFPRAQITIAGIVLLVVYIYFWDAKRAYESVVLGLLVRGISGGEDGSVHSADAQAGACSRIALR